MSIRLVVLAIFIMVIQPVYAKTKGEGVFLYFTNNLNKTVLGTKFENLTIEEVLSTLDINDAEIRNNAGGYYNHSLYFKYYVIFS